MQNESSSLSNQNALQENDGKKSPPIKFVWRNVIFVLSIHLMSLYALTLIFRCRLYTLLFSFVGILLGHYSVSAGAHRLWAHHSYKAKLPLRVVLMLLHTSTMQTTIYEWCRDHRTHHQFSDTDADPHNSKRGAFFSHIGWLMVKKHPEVVRKGKSISVDDLLDDPVVGFQRRHFYLLTIICCFVLPTLVPWYLWGETLWYAYCMNMLRCCTAQNITFTVGSLAHMYGEQPYDKTLVAKENLFMAILTGEGFHNFHHAFPSDYAASEYGRKLNLTTMIIDFMAMIGQATDRKKTSKAAIESRMKRTGAKQM